MHEMTRSGAWLRVSEVGKTMAVSIDRARLDAIFTEWDKPDSPGCGLGVLQAGELVYARGYGMANLEYGIPIAPDSVFHVASVSKQFTALAIALLARDGKLSIDDDVHTYIPELPDFGHTITIRHLILHTSGLRDQWVLLWLGGWREDDLKTNGDVLDLARRQRRLNFVPGAEHLYCNTGYTLMAIIVERVSGQSLRQFTQARVFAPLGMVHTHFHDDHSEIVPGRAYGYVPADDGGFKISIPDFDTVGATSLFTTVEDLARWARNFTERRVASEVLDEMVTPGSLNDGSQLHYGFGLSLGEHRGLRTIGHSGADAGYRSHLVWYPDADFAVVILCNLGPMMPGLLARKVAEVCLADRMGADELADAPAVTLPDADLAANMGLYRDPRTALTCTVGLTDGKLTLSGPLGDPRELTPLGGNRFRLGDPPVEVRFEAGADGARLEMTAPGDPTVSYLAVEPAEPTIEQLAEYAGTYTCPELETSVTLALRDDKLWLERRKFPDSELVPTITDAFADKRVHLVFTRDGGGGITGFELFAGRVRHLWYNKQPSPRFVAPSPAPLPAAEKGRSGRGGSAAV